MVKRYPHTAKLTFVTDGGYDINGDYTPGTSTTKEFPCRAEPNLTGRLITGSDGSSMQYEWKVFYQIVGYPINQGANIEIPEVNFQGVVTRQFNKMVGGVLWL